MHNCLLNPFRSDPHLISTKLWSRTIPIQINRSPTGSMHIQDGSITLDDTLYYHTSLAPTPWHQEVKHFLPTQSVPELLWSTPGDPLDSLAEWCVDWSPYFCRPEVMLIDSLCSTRGTPFLYFVYQTSRWYLVGWFLSHHMPSIFVVEWAPNNLSLL